MKLEAKARLLATQDIEGNPTVSREAEAFMTFVQSLLKSKGFKRTRASKQSALFDWEFTRDKDKRVINLGGWHGTGRYGSSKAIFTLHDTQPNPGAKVGSYGQVFDRGPEMTPDEHKHLLQKMTSYLKDIK